MVHPSFRISDAVYRLHFCVPPIRNDRQYYPALTSALITLWDPGTFILLLRSQHGRFGGSAPAVANDWQCLNGGYGWLEIMCQRCEARASFPLDTIRRPRETPIRKLEALRYLAQNGAVIRSISALGQAPAKREVAAF